MVLANSFLGGTPQKGMTFADGGEIGSTCIERCIAFCSGWYRCDGPQMINANDNNVEFAVAA